MFNTGATTTYWQNAGTTIPSPNPVNTPGTYYIKSVSADGNCFTTKPVTVKINDLPIATVGQTFDCTIQRGTLNISGASAGTRLDYSVGSTYTGGKTFLTASALPSSGIIANNLALQTYTVRLFGADSTCFNDYTVTLNTNNCPKGSIGDYVWKDANRNGKQDATEAGVGAVKVILWSATTTGTPVAKLDSTTTAAGTGKYLFSNLLKGDYVVQFVKSTLPADCSAFTAKDTTAAGTTDTNDSDADKVTGITAKVTLDPKVLSGTSSPADSLATNNLTVDAGLLAPLGSIGDYVWKDANRNGIQDGTEVGVNGVKVILWSATSTGTPIAKLDSATTAAGGKYLFPNLPKGDYVVQFVKSTLPVDCSAFTAKDSTSATDKTDSDADKTTGITGLVSLDPKVLSGTSTPADSLATNNLTVDAGLVAPVILGSIGDYVWKDADKDGVQDATEVGVNGVKVILWSATSTGTPIAKLDSATTAAGGKYLFPNLPKGDYVVQFVKSTLPVDCSAFTAKDSTSATDKTDSDADKTTGITGLVSLDPKVLSGTSTPADSLATNNLTVDAGLVAPVILGSIGDYVWKDADKDGVQDATEVGVNGVKVILWSATTTGSPIAKLDSATTAGGGKYLFSNLPKGDYVVQFVKSTLPVDCNAFTAKDSTSATDKTDSDADKTTGITGKITLDPKLLSGTSTPADSLATNNLTVDAGLVAPVVLGSIGDYVWKDADKDGVQDATEAGVNGVKVILWSATTTGSPIAKLDSATTAGGGKYLFSNLPKGDYVVQFVKSTLPVDCNAFTAKDSTSATDKTDSDADKTTGITGKITLDPKVLSGTSTPADSLATNNLTVDAGLVAPVVLGSIGDYVFKDADKDGVQDATEVGVNGVKVILWSATTTGTPIAKLDSATTAGGGKYLFSNLPKGDYVVQFVKSTLPVDCNAFTAKDSTSATDKTDSDADKTTGITGKITLDPKVLSGTSTPADSLATNNLTVDAGLVVPCVKSKVTLTGAPVCSTDIQTYSISFSITNKVGTLKVNKGVLTGGNPYTVTGIPSGTTIKITDSLSAVCKFDTLITGPNCNCNPTVPTLVTPILAACIGDTFPTLKATVVGLATVEWFTQATGGTAVATGLNFKPAGNVTAAGVMFYAQARSTDPSCPSAISTSRVMATINAQDCTKEVDLALKKSINTKIAQIGNILTYTLKVWNESNTNATGVEVTDSIATTVQFQTGSFTASRGSATITGNVLKWTIGNIAAAGVPANGDTVTLTYRVKATQEGIHFNTAEISKVNEKDVDSTPSNGDDTEDDIERQCFTVPVKLCPGEKAEVNVPTNYTNVQWFKNGNGTPIGTGNSLLLSEVGTYTFTATNQTCPASGCCPIIIEAGVNCCPEDLCIPFTIKQTKKGKK